MRESVNSITYMMKHDPWPVLGLILLGAFALFFVHVQLRMREIGHKTYPLFARPSDWGLPIMYFKVQLIHE
jgi:hypothetical protein